MVTGLTKSERTWNTSKTFQKLSLESPGQNLALTGLYVPYSLDSEPPLRFPSPHGGVQPFHQKSNCPTQLTLGPYLMQIGIRSPADLHRRNVKRFRRGLVFKAHRPLFHSTLGSKVIKKKKKDLHHELKGGTGGHRPHQFRANREQVKNVSRPLT
jgi:hypothetical protein